MRLKENVGPLSKDRIENAANSMSQREYFRQTNEHIERSQGRPQMTWMEEAQKRHKMNHNGRDRGHRDK